MVIKIISCEEVVCALLGLNKPMEIYLKNERMIKFSVDIETVPKSMS